MAFASIYVPHFFVQSVVRAEAALRERAVVLVDGNPPLEKVVAMSEAASGAGIQLGMTKSQAIQFSGIEIRNCSRTQEERQIRKFPPCSDAAGRHRLASCSHDH